jgi:hypothetical protein
MRCRNGGRLANRKAASARSGSGHVTCDRRSSCSKRFMRATHRGAAARFGTTTALGLIRRARGDYSTRWRLRRCAVGGASESPASDTWAERRRLGRRVTPPSGVRGRRTRHERLDLQERGVDLGRVSPRRFDPEMRGVSAVPGAPVTATTRVERVGEISRRLCRREERHVSSWSGLARL